MKITVYYPTRLPVHGYGGTERMATNLIRGLAARGHEVSLIARSDSQVPEATLIPVGAADARAQDFPLDPLLPKGTDLLLAYVGPTHAPTSVPWVKRLGANRSPGAVNIPNTIYVSRDHARRHGGNCWVHNGADPAEFRFGPVKGSYDLFIGRLHAVKGYHWAIAGAKRTGRLLKIAADWRPSFDPRVRYVGEVGGAKKADLLARARLVWMPALWDDPCPGVLIEAMASGTPVLGTGRASLPEIITPDVGRLGGTLDELIALLPETERIAPEACRARYEKYFTHHVMAAEYERVLTEYVRTGALPNGRAPEERGM